MLQTVKEIKLLTIHNLESQLVFCGATGLTFTVALHVLPTVPRLQHSVTIVTVIVFFLYAYDISCI